jgi:hypothetical protein
MSNRFSSVQGIYSVTTAIRKARLFSDEKLEQLRRVIDGLVPGGDIVVANGSYARREASEGSDIDFYVLTNGKRSPEPTWVDQVRRSVLTIVPVEPAKDGTFSNVVESPETLLRNIGGDQDSNATITRRLLLLLEGEWLFNSEGLKELRRDILQRYIGEKITDHQLALFLLNDIIRYYRTMAVDYENKIEGDVKPWGIRNIKLVFSRKLLYASGLFSVGMTADRTRNSKVSTLEQLFDMPVIDRMIAICGKSNVGAVLSSYNQFLQKLDQTEIREKLKSLSRDQRDDPLFRELKNEGHLFTRELLKLFDQTFDGTHPIRRAIIF